MKDLTRSFYNFFNYSGRATRREFIFFVFLYFILTRILLLFISLKLTGAYPSLNFYSLTDLLVIIDHLFIKLPILFIFIRRSHDVGISGGLSIFIYLLNVADYYFSDYIVAIYNQLIADSPYADYSWPYGGFILIVNIGLFIYLACWPSDVENEYGLPN